MGYVTAWDIHDGERLCKCLVTEDYAYHYKRSVSVSDDERRHNVYSHLPYHNHKMMMRYYYDDGEGRNCRVKQGIDDHSLGRLY